MFQWVNDAMSYMSEAISAAWTSTVNTANDITDAVFEAMFQWIFGLVYECMGDLFMLINNTATDIFSLAWVQAFVSLFGHLAWMLFICGFVVSVFDTAIAYENGQNNIKSCCLNILKGYFAANLVTQVPQRLYTFCTTMQGTFAADLIRSYASTAPSSVAEAAKYVTEQLNENQSLSNLLLMILFGYCTVKVVLANIKRGGILLCQIAVGSMYLFSVPRGFTDGFIGWCKQVIATCLTAFLQTTILYLGLMTFDTHPILALGICLSANEVPRVAQVFGLDTSVHLNMTSVSSAASVGSRAVKLLAKH